MLPTTEIRIAGGREVNLRSLQPLALYPGNSLFINGYLTTGGQSADEAIAMVADMGFDVDVLPIQIPTAPS
jgi:biotin synthase